MLFDLTNSWHYSKACSVSSNCIQKQLFIQMYMSRGLEHVKGEIKLKLKNSPCELVDKTVTNE